MIEVDQYAVVEKGHVYGLPYFILRRSLTFGSFLETKINDKQWYCGYVGVPSCHIMYRAGTSTINMLAPGDVIGLTVAMSGDRVAIDCPAMAGFQVFGMDTMNFASANKEHKLDNVFQDAFQHEYLQGKTKELARWLRSVRKNKKLQRKVARLERWRLMWSG